MTGTVRGGVAGAGHAVGNRGVAPHRGLPG